MKGVDFPDTEDTDADAAIEPVTFAATLDNIRTDRDCETKLVLLIPLSEMENVKKLHDLHGENILRVTVSVEN